MKWVLLVVCSPIQQQQVPTGWDHEGQDPTSMSWDDTPPPSQIGPAKTRDPVEPAEKGTYECVSGHQQSDVELKSIVL
jgi:hypothetical protein